MTFRPAPGSPASSAPGWRQAIGSIVPALAKARASETTARLLMAHGRMLEAEAVLREVVTQDPDKQSALKALAQLLRFRGQGDEAVLIMRQACRSQATAMGLSGDDLEEAIAFLLAAEGCGPQPGTMPPAYAARTFDAYEDYDDHLVGGLGYRAPGIFRALVDRHLAPVGRSLRILDLGCGTGLTGAALRDVASHLTGVDLAPKMIDRARAKGIYDVLVVQDAITWLGALPPGTYDLIIAADLLPYLGDLDPLASALRLALRPGAACCWCAELCEGEGFRLSSTRRFAHSRAYVQSCAARHGLHVLMDEQWVRQESGQPVSCLTGILRL